MVLRRLRAAARPSIQLEPHPDEMPKTGLFTEPLRITKLDALTPEPVAGGTRVTFLVEVKDAEDKRCSDIAVDAAVDGPERSATVQATTDMFGRVRIRMTGPPGDYAVEVLEVGAKALRWDAAAGPSTATTHVPA